MPAHPPLLHRLLTVASAFILGAAPFARAEETPPYLDPSQPLDKRVDDLISRMTIEEKAAELYHNTPQNDRLHIPYWGGWNQCLHGVWSKQPTTLFPVSIAAAATWDPALVHDEADAISDEARALFNIGAQGPHGRHGLVYRAPVINISRDPRWGRIQECYGEDPFLTSRIGVAYVQGLQGSDPKYLKVASTLKHFAINNQEKGRETLSAEVPERMFYEYWLPHFRACIVEGHAQSIMAAYNAINGTPCALNKLLLTDVLRGQWHFDGFVVSDLNGVNHLIKRRHVYSTEEDAAANAIKAGCDMDDEDYAKGIPGAVKQGLITEADVNRALSRVLHVAYRLGAFDSPETVPFSKLSADVINSPAHRELALKLSHESIALLANKENFLPLDKTKLKTVAVIGPLAEHPETGNYYGAKPQVVGPLEGLKKKLGDAVEVKFAPGCGVTEAAKPGDLDAAVELAKQSDVAILFLGTNTKVEGEGHDRKDLNLPGAQEELLEAVYKANPKTVVVLSNAGPLAVKWAKENVPAILESWFAGEEGGDAIADVLFGDYNPAGRLPYTTYASVDQIPPQTEYDVTKGFTYMYFAGEPVFPFGYGLSYTSFDYSNFNLSAKQLAADAKLTATVDVQNTGRRAGDEVVQLYAHQQQCSVKQPLKKLVGFKRIHLDPGEKQTVTLDFAPEQMAIWDVTTHAFVVEPGTFDVFVGGSSADERAKDQFEVTAAK